MRILRNTILPPRSYDAINLFGLLFCRKETRLSARLLRHELIHTRQMREMLYVGFYVWYLMEWLVRLFMPGNAYHNISFEREAYLHMDDAAYLSERRPYAWMKHLRSDRKKTDF